MNPAVVDAIQAFAQFLGGAAVGFLVAIGTTYVNARIRVMESVLTDHELVDQDQRRRWINGDRILTVTIVVVMIAMLLAGVSWIRSGQTDAENRRQDCLRAAETSRVLRARTANYIDAAESEVELWRGMRRALLGMGGKPDSPIVENIDRYLKDRAEYVRHLRENPYPDTDAEGC